MLEGKAFTVPQDSLKYEHHLALNFMAYAYLDKLTNNVDSLLKNTKLGSLLHKPIL